MDRKYNDPEYVFTDMDIHVTIRKEIRISQNADLRLSADDATLSLSASKVFPQVNPDKLQNTLLAVKNYAREFNQTTDEMFLQCAEKANQCDDKSQNSDPELKPL